MSKSLKRNIFIYIFIFILGFLTYVNILSNKLFYDDEELIYQNYYVQNPRLLPKYFTENMVAGAGKKSNMYRPVLLTSFALDYAVWKNNPLGYHLTSIILHAANGIFIFIFINWLFRNKLLAFLTSLLFIIHPVQTEAIAYASGRTDPLYSFFGLSSLLLFTSLLKKDKYFIAKYIFSIIFFILSLLSKETAIIFPAIFLLTYFTQKEYKTSVKKILLILMPFIVITIIYIFLRLTVLNFANTLNFYREENLYSQNLLVRLLTFFAVFFQYFSIIFLPYELVFARSAPIIVSPLNLWVIIFIFAFLTFLILSLVLRKTNNLFIFSFFWFFICIFPVSGIIPINNIIAEHYLYLPSVAFFLIAGFLFCFLYKKYHRANQRILLIFLGTIICLLLFLRTVTRNTHWHDPITFYIISLKQSPWHIPMRHNLAMTYAEKGDLELAISQYKQIIETSDVYPNTHHNLANIYKNQGRYKEAEEEYQKALSLDPNFRFSYVELLDLYQKTGEKDKADTIRKKL